jgi:hypothetical protein
MARDRFLTGILIGIGVLVAAALILFFIRQGQMAYGDDSTPAGVTRNYLLALQRSDYERAYSYIASSSTTLDFMSFRRPFVSDRSSGLTSLAIEVGEETIDAGGDTALVEVTIIRYTDSLFGDVYRDRQPVYLVRRDGAWKIQSAPYPFWSYDWE